MTGTLVRASVLARLLGIRLLRLDADIAVVPVDNRSPVDVAGRPPPYRAALPVGTLDDAAKLLVHASRTLDSGRP